MYKQTLEIGRSHPILFMRDSNFNPDNEWWDKWEDGMDYISFEDIVVIDVGVDNEERETIVELYSETIKLENVLSLRTNDILLGEKVLLFNGTIKTGSGSLDFGEVDVEYSIPVPSPKTQVKIYGHPDLSIREHLLVFIEAIN